MRTALIQMTSSDDPDANTAALCDLISEAADNGAGFVTTPEVCNCLSTSRRHQADVLRLEEEDRTLAAMQDLAAKRGIWLLLGSLALKTGDPDGRFANRSFVIGPDGAVVGRYDKIHMFDVTVSERETYRESAGYRPGKRLTLVPTPFGKLGLTICYDLRFPHIFQALAKAGAEIITVPSAFSPETGKVHWDALLRARAIENGSYVLAPAQTGVHPARNGHSRTTYGHSLAVSPWGEILANAAMQPNILYININAKAVAEARNKIPSLSHGRAFEGP